MKPQEARQLYDQARQKYANDTAQALLKLIRNNSGVLSTAGGAAAGTLGGYLASLDSDWAKRNPRAYRVAMLNNMMTGTAVGGGLGALAHGAYNAKKLVKDIQETPPIEEEFKANNAPEEVAFVAKDRKGKPLNIADAGTSTALTAASLLGMSSFGKLQDLNKSRNKNKKSKNQKKTTYERYRDNAIHGGKSTAALLALLNGRNALDSLGAHYAPSWLDIPAANSVLSPLLPNWARAARQYARGPGN